MVARCELGEAPYGAPGTRRQTFGGLQGSGASWLALNRFRIVKPADLFTLAVIALGGAAGTAARYGLGGLIQRGSSVFPIGTLTINVTGSLLLGFLARYLLDTSTSAELRAALTIGFCGGYTTFSTFSYETVVMLERGEYARAAAYVSASLVLSLLGTFVGFAAARAAFAPPR